MAKLSAASRKKPGEEPHAAREPRLATPELEDRRSKIFLAKSVSDCNLNVMMNRFESDDRYPVIFFVCLVGYVEERLWWPIQSLNKGRKKNANS